MKMAQKVNILEELAELKSSLATMAPNNIYSVPEGYFEGLAAQVLCRIRALEAENAETELAILSPLLSGISKQMPYSVPAGYFETLAEIASAQQSSPELSPAEELETISPLLSGLKKEMPYTVPPGYFESIRGQAPVTAAKAVVRRFSVTRSSWFRYAAAAVITGLIITAGFLFLGGEKERGGKALSKFTRDIKKMDDSQKADLIDFIDAGLSSTETAQAGTDSKSEVRDLLQDISVEELKDFQQQSEDIQSVLITE